MINFGLTIDSALVEYLNTLGPSDISILVNMGSGNSLLHARW